MTISSSARLAAVNAQAMAHYQQMRGLVMAPATVDPATAETVLALQLAVIGLEAPFKIHAARAMSLNVSKAQLQALVVAGVGVTLLASQAGAALRWLDEA
ncbi:hypothetical protein [Hydrogenophaga sp.]|uniref:hypothetical protein n=1 Tax=Hydrogenophaga sp. TaxID=1904254 RepID=UPI0027199327|nr:hypothetical protein [Hydrogenophaga sp.]MDO9437241.1 hypothetical protein [Hydrogenophaga sp.]